MRPNASRMDASRQHGVQPDRASWRATRACDSQKGGVSVFNPSVVLFRRAQAAALSARGTASGAVEWMATPRAREVDDTIITLLLAHAAIESAWHWVQMDEGVAPPHWPGGF